MSAFVVTPKPLIESKYAANSQQTEYTVPGSKTTIVDSFTATNQDSVNQTVTVYIIPSGQPVSAAFIIVSAYSLSPGQAVSFDVMKNQILSTGDIINVFASASSKVVIRCSGREVA